MQSPNHDARPSGVAVDMLVLHYTGMQSARAAIDKMCDPDAGVSAHYMVDEDGAISQLVDEDRRAWHAGESWWRGNRDINARAIGIELVNPGHEFGLRPYPDQQMQALQSLALEILRRHQIPARNVVGHSDIAPRRKTDPGELFDWHGLFRAGLGVWPEEKPIIGLDGEQAKAQLQAFGYETVDMKMTVAAFQRHFRPSQIDGVLDEETLGLLGQLILTA